MLALSQAAFSQITGAVILLVDIPGHYPGIAEVLETDKPIKSPLLLRDY